MVENLNVKNFTLYREAKGFLASARQLNLKQPRNYSDTIRCFRAAREAAFAGNFIKLHHAISTEMEHYIISFNKRTNTNV